LGVYLEGLECQISTKHPSNIFNFGGKMLQLLRLDHYSSEILLFLLLAVLIGGFVVGFVTDSVMGDRGFGPFGNGTLAVLGAVVGIYIRNTFFGRMDPGDLLVTGIFASATATLLLLLLGVAKHWVQD
jgi:uncharacterized membrane protein YeaQ/YmgE (transglycosylase-associated protein family)